MRSIQPELNRKTTVRSTATLQSFSAHECEEAENLARTNCEAVLGERERPPDSGIPRCACSDPSISTFEGYDT